WTCMLSGRCHSCSSFSIQHSPTIDIYTLSLHDALPIFVTSRSRPVAPKTATQREYIAAIRSHDLTFGIGPAGTGKTYLAMAMAADRKSTRLNSSHVTISYAVFCLKKKKRCTRT